MNVGYQRLWFMKWFNPMKYVSMRTQYIIKH